MASQAPHPAFPLTPLDTTTQVVDVDGQQRPARNNRNQLLHWSEEGVRNFWRWFGDSKVVDGEGRPIVMYHATHVGENPLSRQSLGDIDAFDRFTTRRVFGRQALDQVGSWFSDSPGKQGAGMYGGDALYATYLRVAEPWSVRFQGLWRQAQKRSGQLETNRPNADSVSALDAYMDDVGIDGVRIIHDQYDPGSREFESQDVWVARSPRQIKSAIGNSGLFDPSSDFMADPVDWAQYTATAEQHLIRSRDMDIDGEKRPGNDASIFVFGSNLAGRHGKGAALDAKNEHGAVYGVGVGRTGNSYAIPTKDESIQTLPLERIEVYVSDFLDYARANPSLTFEVTRVGCGLAGYSDADIAPMFYEAPGNCNLPDGWRPALEATSGGGEHHEAQRNDSIVLVAPEQMQSFQKRLDSLNKKAVAFGLEPIKITDTKDVIYERKFEYTGRDKDTLESRLVPLQDGHHTDHPVMLKRIGIEYPEVKLGNWRVVGKLEAIEGGNLAFSVSQNAVDVQVLNGRADHPIECEHCNTKRKRNDSYLLKDQETDEYKQVGNSCLEDFTGHDPAAALFFARMYDVVRITEGELEEYGRASRANAVNTRHYLADVSFISERSGFVSAAKARDTNQIATYDAAMGLGDALDKNPTLRQEYLEEREKHLAKADAIRDWVAASTGESSFDQNLKLLLQLDAIAMERKHLAFSAAAVPMYNRSLTIAAEARKPSEHIGSPGEKMTTTLTIHRIVPMESQFGVTHLVLMHDKDGNNVKWKASACPYEMRTEGVGRTMECTFKIKEHDNYKDKAQTAVTHLKVVRWLDPENTAEKMDDDPTAHGPEMSTYGASIFMHPADVPRGYSNIVMASNGLSGDALVAEAKGWAITQLQSEGENQWLTSGPDDYGNTYSLHLHSVDDKEPTPSDFKHVEDMLGASPARRLEAEDNKPPVYESQL